MDIEFLPCGLAERRRRRFLVQHADAVLLSRSNLVPNNFIFIEPYIISGVSPGFPV
jgi:hypothetical protein